MQKAMQMRQIANDTDAKLKPILYSAAVSDLGTECARRNASK